MPSTKIYFAREPVDKIGACLMEKIEDYYEFLINSGRMDLWRRSYNAYFSQSCGGGGRLRKSGEQGEFTNINVSHYRNFLQHLLTMTTQQRPAFDPKATNTDVKSQSQVILAGGLLEYYVRQKQMERYVKTGVENCLVFDEGFCSTGWRVEDGEVYGINPETKAEITEGDIYFESHTPLDAIRDITKTNSCSHNWIILRTFRNKYDIAAKYEDDDPELAEKILALSPSHKDLQKTTFNLLDYEDSDEIPYYVFYHKKTKAVPNGRMIELLDADTILIDTALPYREIPVYRIAPAEQTGTIFGYTVGYDLLPVQEALDGLYSTVITNQSTFGVQNIAAPRGHNMSVTEIAGGLNLLEYDPKFGAPTPLNLTQTPPEIFNFMQQLERLGETLSGVNSVARGNPEASLKSGAALALVQSMAVQFSMGLQQSYAQLLEDLSTAVIYILRDFASVPRIAMIAGKANRTYLKEFTGKDLSEINRVLVDLGNPLTRTIAGRVNLAETLLQNGLVKDPDQYVQVLTTGKLEPVIEGTQAELMLIRAENERIAEGGQAMAALTDEHLQHIKEHKVVIASPEARENPDVLTNALAHIKEHLDILLNPANAQMLIALGQEPMGMPPPPPPGGASNGAAGQGLDPSNPISQEQPRQPTLPNPPAGTDEKSAAVIAQQQQALTQGVQA